MTASIVAVGAVFMLLGAWLYKSPRRMVPVWGIFNREHPAVQRVGKIYATFIIFVGAFAVAGSIALLLLPIVAPIVGLAVALVLTLLLRRVLTPPDADPIEPSVPVRTSVPKPSLLSGHWKRNLLILAGFAILLAGAVMRTIGNSDVSKLAFAEAQASSTVKDRLGEPVRRGFFVSGSIEISGPTGKADIAIPISGPRGNATVYAVARKDAGLWKFETLQVSFGDENIRADLLQHMQESDPR